MDSTSKVSILVLTHNAPKYVKLTIDSVRKYTKGVEYEVCVVDNASRLLTRVLLKWLCFRKSVNRVVFSSHNTLFAAGNNILSMIASKESKYFLLLNSDVEIRDNDWLSNLLKVHKKGITSYGVVESEPYRVDGYCYLIDSELYRRFPLDGTNFQWFWAITKQQAQVLTSGYNVQGFKEHENYVHHFGGKSGGDFKGADGINTSFEISNKWFKGKRVKFL